METAADALRVFATDEALPADAINNEIDRRLVPDARVAPPEPESFDTWRSELLAKLRERPFATLRASPDDGSMPAGDDHGFLPTESPLGVTWRAFRTEKPSDLHWLVLLCRDDPEEELPSWARAIVGEAPAVAIGVRGTGSSACPSRGETAENHLERALLLSGRSLDSGRVQDVMAAVRACRERVAREGVQGAGIAVVGRGRMGMVGAYAALFAPAITSVTLIAPPASHMADGSPQFPGVLRVLDIPVALGLLAPRPLRLLTPDPAPFGATREIYARAGAAGALRLIDEDDRE
jgi:hypothetical protein